jgi:hypothetical protein
MRGALLLGAVLASAGLAPGARAQEQGGTAAFEACGRIAEDAARHACLDEALRAAGMLDEAAPGAEPPAERAAPPVAETPRAPAAEGPSLAPPPAPPVRTAAAPPPPPPGLTREEREPEREPYLTSIVTARLIGNHTLEIATPDAGRWVSTERQTFRRTPDRGDALEIVPAALGGYRCRLERSTLFACRRVE